MDLGCLCVLSLISTVPSCSEYAVKLGWWDKSQSQGPIIEQATHFVDLSRFFGGEVDLKSVSARTVEHDTSAGRLGKQGFDEDKIDAANRIPRITAAVWQYESGAVGTLMHSVALHGKLCARLVVPMS